MSHALSEPVRPERPRWVRRLVLQGITVVILGWVSYGSHEVLTWIGMPWWPAWLYPAIVDLAVLYVTPFAVDPALPADERRHARNTRKMILPVVTFFNIFHMILFVQQHRPSVPEPGLEVATQVFAYLIAVITGCIPVAAYARVTTLETMDKANEVASGVEARRTAAQRAEQKRLDDEAFVRQQEAEQVAHDRKMEELQAEADAREKVRLERESRKESRRESSATPAAATRGKPAEAAGNPLVAELPGKTKFEKLMALLEQQWAEGKDLNGTDAAKLLGADPKYGRQAKTALKERGILPPSERSPHLVAVARS